MYQSLHLVLFLSYRWGHWELGRFKLDIAIQRPQSVLTWSKALTRGPISLTVQQEWAILLTVMSIKWDHVHKESSTLYMVSDHIMGTPVTCPVVVGSAPQKNSFSSSCHKKEHITWTHSLRALMNGWVGAMIGLSHNQMQMRSRKKQSKREKTGPEALSAPGSTTYYLPSPSHKSSLRKSLHAFPETLQHAFSRVHGVL